MKAGARQGALQSWRWLHMQQQEQREGAGSERLGGSFLVFEGGWVSLGKA